MNEKVYRDAANAEEKGKARRAKKGEEQRDDLLDSSGSGSETGSMSDDELTELREKLEEMEKEAQANNELYLRASADLENYKVRANKERAEYIRHANDKVIGEFLSILDNMERALEHSGSSDDFESLAGGVQHIHDNMITVLETLGLKPVEAVGATFDPNIHEAISHEEDGDSEPGTVIREFKKGYFLHDRLLRPATVSVSKAPETPEAEDDAEEAGQ